MLDLLKYIFLFIGICGAIILGIALLNIYTKSYKPKNSLFIIIGLLFLFLVNGVMAIDALNRSITGLGDTLNTTQQNNNQSSGSKLF